MGEVAQRRVGRQALEQRLLGGALHVLRQFGGAGEHRVFIVGAAELRLFSGGDRSGVLADFGQVAVGALDEDGGGADLGGLIHGRSEEHTSELTSLMSTSYAVFCLQQ